MRHIFQKNFIAILDVPLGIKIEFATVMIGVTPTYGGDAGRALVGSVSAGVRLQATFEVLDQVGASGA
jgi:hypothetical protein